VPKTLIFAKDDSHAEDIVRIVREEFGKGNDFCQKITYRVSGKKPEDLIAEFRNSYNPRIAVTVDMIATGTDIKPLEVLLFMRAVKSRVLFEQMLGRGTRVINSTDLQAVTPDAHMKTHFVIVDAVGTVEQTKVDVQPLERKKSVPFDKLIEAVAWGARDEDTLLSLAGRLATLARTLSPQDEQKVAAATGGRSLHEVSGAIIDALDVDKQYEAARAEYNTEEPTDQQIHSTAQRLVEEATAPFDDPDLRITLVELQRSSEQIIDTVSVDVVREAGFSQSDTERARSTVESFRRFIEEHRDDITALQLLYSKPYRARAVTYADIKALADTISRPPLGWTADALWDAYARLERDRVKGVGTRRQLTDLVALVRHALDDQGDLVPYPELVRERYVNWLAAQEAEGRLFTPEQRWWLDHIAEHIGVNLTIDTDDFDYGDFFDRGGRLAAARTFGTELASLLSELNTTLVA
jgi:type I restriction enzyme, R subunit